MAKTQTVPQKSVQISPETVAAIRTALKGLTLVDRVKRAMEAIAVVTAAMTPQGDHPDTSIEFDSTDAEAIRGVLMRAYDELFWVTRLDVNIETPTDDQRSALQQLDGVR